MEPHEIKAEIVRNRSRLKIIAESFNPPVTSQAVDRVIQRKSVSRRIQERVAQVIKKEFDEVWPKKEAA